MTDPGCSLTAFRHWPPPLQWGVAVGLVGVLWAIELLDFFESRYNI